MKKILINELAPVYLFIASIVLFIILTGMGFLHLVVKAIYHTFQLKFWRGPIYFFTYWFKVLYQIWVGVKYMLLHFAISVDLVGNVICGEAVEDCVTAEENTLYGNGSVTISAATGQLELMGKLNKTGMKFTSVLSKTLGENHSIVAYQNYLKNG